MPRITLHSLKCEKQTDDGAGKEDEIYIKLNADGDLNGQLPENAKYWDMTKGSTEPINRQYEFVHEFRVTVMESDNDKDDWVGDFTFLAEVQAPGSPLVFTGADGIYELSFGYEQ